MPPHFESSYQALSLHHIHCSGAIAPVLAVVSGLTSRIDPLSVSPFRLLTSSYEASMKPLCSLDEASMQPL